MATRIVMSKLSPTMEEGRVLHWVKQEGDPVESGDVVVEVETDKANMEVEAMGTGILRKILVQEDATVPTGTILGVIAGADEDISTLLAEATSAAQGTATVTETAQPEPRSAAAVGEGKASGRDAASKVAAVLAPDAGPRARPTTATAESRRDGGRLRASPLARRLADERGIELHLVHGTGPGGRIIKRDIEAAAQAGTLAAVAPDLVAGPTPFERVELTQIRKAIARNTAQSLGPIPHFYLTTEIDMGRVMELRAQLNHSLTESGIKIGINDILVKTAARALLEHPDVNVAFAGDHIRRFTRVDVGIAVALADGLITPIVRNAAAKGLKEISVESRDLIDKARDRRLAPDEYEGATFTVSNLGMYGIDEFTAVINPPAATILAVGATQEKPVVVDGKIEIRARMRVTLSCDHRAVDGAMGAEFLATFRGMLENPLRLAL